MQVLQYRPNHLFKVSESLPDVFDTKQIIGLRHVLEGQPFLFIREISHVSQDEFTGGPEGRRNSDMHKLINYTVLEPNLY